MKWRKISIIETQLYDLRSLIPLLRPCTKIWPSCFVDPDRFSTPKEKAVGKKKFQEITAAYSVLRDPKKRKSYDMYGRV